MARTEWSEATQKTNLAEGLAAAVLCLDVVGITSQRFAVERAFEHAWASWRHLGEFRQVRATLARNDIVSVLNRSEGRRATYTAYWATQLPARYFTPCLGDPDEAPEEALAFIAKSTAIPAEDWLDLARQFVDDLDRSDGAVVRVESTE